MSTASSETGSDDWLDTEYEYHSTFLAFASAFNDKPVQGQSELKLQIEQVYREAARVAATQGAGVQCRFDVWVPLKHPKGGG